MQLSFEAGGREGEGAGGGEYCSYIGKTKVYNDIPNLILGVVQLASACREQPFFLKICDRSLCCPKLQQ